MAGKKAKKSKAKAAVAPSPKATTVAATANGTAPPAELTGNQREGGVERARFVEDLPCKLNLEEIEAVRQRLLEVTIEKVHKESEKAVLSEAIKGLDKRERSLVEQLNDKEEMRPVDCVEIFYRETMSVDTIRLDTGEVLKDRTRAATTEDQQLDMDGVIARNAIEKAMSAGSKLDQGIARAVAEMPPKAFKHPLDVDTAKPEDLAPKPGTLGGPGEAARTPPPAAAKDDDDDADGPIGGDPDDDPLGLGET